MESSSTSLWSILSGLVGAPIATEHDQPLRNCSCFSCMCSRLTALTSGGGHAALCYTSFISRHSTARCHTDGIRAPTPGQLLWLTASYLHAGAQAIAVLLLLPELTSLRGLSINELPQYVRDGEPSSSLSALACPTSQGTQGCQQQPSLSHASHQAATCACKACCYVAKCPDAVCLVQPRRCIRPACMACSSTAGSTVS